ncbi:hypothetical protein C0995_006415 [Termitomyces sp. Mi166|nr:hypothetical protein C0995_006415 [Termitomyces sp. Mi166\
MNNDLAWAIILTALDESEYEGLDKIKTAADLYTHVKTQAEGKGPYKPVQAQISCGLADSMKEAPYTSNNIRKLLETIQNLTNLKSPGTGHEAPYCTHPGGAMEKQSIEAAQNAAKAAAVKVSTSVATTTGNTKVYTQLTSPKGKVYLVEEGDLGKLQTLSNKTAPSTPAGFAGLTTDNIE